jgi:outer membrane immunogenic protein
VRRYSVQFLLAAEACILIGANTRASATEAQSYDWSGAYIGVHGGYVWTKPEWEDCCSFPGPVTTPFDSLDGSSAIFGLQAGYNWQFSNMVIGLESNLSKADISTSAERSDFMAAGGTKFEWMADVTARAGYPIGPSLLYAKGGVAFTRVENYWTFDGLDPFQKPMARGTDNLVGWTLGLGTEFGITKQISARLEYDYFDFGKSDSPLTYVFSNGGVPSERRLTAQAVKFGINYRF